MAPADWMQGRGASGLVLAQALAVAPPLAVTLWLGPPGALAVLATALAVALAWDAAFAVLRRRRFEPQGITSAAIFALFAPPDLPLWHLVVVLSLACVIGERVFGGRGFGFLSPATVALALALLALPGLTLAAPGEAVALACLPGLALMLALRLLSVGLALTFVGVLAASYGAASSEALGALAVLALPALVFLVCDPTAAAVTRAGRIAQGALAGALVPVFGGAGALPASADALVLAALLASLFAPLLDNMAVALHVAMRGRRHG